MTAEPRVGVYGLRTFRVSDDGHLLPLLASRDNRECWYEGSHEAFCLYTATAFQFLKDHRILNEYHEVPHDRCSCGVYATRTYEHLHSQYPECASDLVAVVELSGRAIEGTKGWRAQAGRVISLWVRPGALPDDVLTQLRSNYPAVKFCEDFTGMLESWGISRGMTPPPDKSRTEVVVQAIAGVAAWTTLVQSVVTLLTMVVPTFFGVTTETSVTDASPLSLVNAFLLVISGILFRYAHKRRSRSLASAAMVLLLMGFTSLYAMLGLSYLAGFGVGFLAFVFLKISSGSFNPFRPLMGLVWIYSKSRVRE